MIGPLDVRHSRILRPKVTDCNTDYLYLIEHSAARWTKMEDKVSVNQDAVVIPLLWQGQLCCSNRKRQGILLDAS
jgi:hypothetical protein